MANRIREIFESIMKDENIECIPEKSLSYKDTFRFSSILNIEEKFEYFFLKSKRMYTIQKSIRTTEKILDIIGKEGVATPLTYMMSFFLTKEKNLEYAMSLTFRFFYEIGIDKGNIFLVVSEDMLENIKTEDKIIKQICVVDKTKLSTSLGTKELRGEYVKFYFKNLNGFIPIGTLNILRKKDSYVVDSSFILECDLVASNFANSIYNTDIFTNSYRLISKWDNVIGKCLKYRLLSFLRLILTCMYNGIVPGNKGKNFTIRKLLRNLICDMYIDIIEYNKIYNKKYNPDSYINSKFMDLVDSISEDLLLLDQSINFDKKDNIKNILEQEIKIYIKLLIKSEDFIICGNYSLEKLMDEKGIPKKLIDYYFGEKYSLIDNGLVSMNPIFDDVLLESDVWLRKLHS
ncbi:hypothetical protein VJJ74_06025 [Parvimonas micra]|uniref:hypothetical protein n=1 Tax=Parvimonas micra TaxID=33033 RepID=UPI002B47F3D7|nr:hypothetical protein [Parvimonas micra]MEB3060699.1 hypothetical protein [Parvimonas micra]MEB3066728.1 hypothetical protein [Parvimonas micra]